MEADKNTLVDVKVPKAIAVVFVSFTVIGAVTIAQKIFSFIKN